MRVFLLDDHELVQRGVGDGLLAEEDIVVVGGASTGEEALRPILGWRAEAAAYGAILAERRRTKS